MMIKHHRINAIHLDRLKSSVFKNVVIKFNNVHILLQRVNEIGFAKPRRRLKTIN